MSRALSNAVICGVLTFLALPALAAPRPINETAIAQVRAVADNHLMGTAVLVATDRAGQIPVLFFLTAVRLFDSTDGEPTSPPVRLTTVTGESIDVDASQVTRATRNLAGITLLRVPWAGCPLVPLPLDFGGPDVGGIFVIAGLRGDGSSVDVPERIQSRTASLVSGDRTIAELDAPLGAPAISAHGVFGVVTSAEADGPPTITLLSAASQFLARQLPASKEIGRGRSAPSLFRITEKTLTGPMLSVKCDTENTGEVTLPYRLALNERLVDATASFTNPRSVRLADLTVLALDDRTITLRFSLVGVPPPAFVPPAPCQPGQALVTVRVNVISLPHPE